MCINISRSPEVAYDIYTTREGENLRDAYIASVQKALMNAHTFVEPISDEKFNYLVKSHTLNRRPYFGHIPVPESEKELHNLLTLEAKYIWQRLHLNREKRTNPSCINLASQKRAVISGQSVSGMIAAVVLAKAGYEVHTYEVRENYTRNIQWAIRASLVNTLASIDEKLAALFKKIAGPLHKGSLHIKNGVVRNKQHEHLVDVDPHVIPPDGKSMIKMDSIFTIEARAFEQEMRKYLLDNWGKQIHRHVGKIELERRGQSFEVKNDNLGTPDLIVIAEGGNSSTRNSLLQPKPMTESRWQIAGAIAVDGEGTMVKHWRVEDGQCMLTGAIGHAGSKKNWIVADVHPSFAGCKDQKRIDVEFRKVAAIVLQKPIEEIARLAIYGPSDQMKITPFPLQQTLVDAASIGNNLIFMGDTVGTGHWSSGGGLQIAVVCHAQHLNTLALKLYNAVFKSWVIQEYSHAVLSDTKAWLEEGCKDFYPPPVEVFAPLSPEEYHVNRQRDFFKYEIFSNCNKVFSWFSQASLAMNDFISSQVEMDHTLLTSDKAVAVLVYPFKKLAEGFYLKTRATVEKWKDRLRLIKLIR